MSFVQIVWKMLLEPDPTISTLNQISVNTWILRRMVELVRVSRLQAACLFHLSIRLLVLLHRQHTTVEKGGDYRQSLVVV